MGFKLIYAVEIFDDLQENIDWYNIKQSGLGARFFKAVSFLTVQKERFQRTFWFKIGVKTVLQSDFLGENNVFLAISSRPQWLNTQ